ncbi:MAG: hypothetical protein ABII88_02980 [Candidatus Omnitrophota bacterium]
MIGQIIDTQWNDIPNQYGNIELDQYTIMPNHLHGIVIINNRAEASAAPTLSQIEITARNNGIRPVDVPRRAGAGLKY